jgi:PilZ domain
MSNTSRSSPVGPEAVDAPERRASIRHPMGFPALCTVVSTQPAQCFSVSVRDISLTGIGLFVPAALEPNALVCIELPGTGKLNTRALLAQVHHTRKVFEGRWMVGCAFIGMLKKRDLRLLLAQRFAVHRRARQADCGESSFSCG